MKITAEDLKKLGIIDKILKEPDGGAHNDSEKMSECIKDTIIKEIKKLSECSKNELIENRYKKFRNIGEYKIIEEVIK